jgi:tRNA dimethylallyltransferase
MEKSVEEIKKNSRRYAKRQMTWLNSKENIFWVNDKTNIENIKNLL